MLLSQILIGSGAIIYSEAFSQATATPEAIEYVGGMVFGFGLFIAGSMMGVSGL